MGKLAFIFSGQGAQKVGMGMDIAENYPVAMDVFDTAGKVLDLDIKNMIWHGDNATLMITENTQPCVVTMSAAVLAVLREKGIKPDVVAGLSLGEYTAHVASGSLKFEDAVRLVKKRGKYMQQAVPVGVGAMAAILGLDDKLVEESCAIASDVGYVSPANYNCPGQIVIAGEIKAVEKACEICKEKGAKRAMLLPVSAPFHCEMLKSAGIKLKEDLENIKIYDMIIPVITNVTADYISSKEDIKDLLVSQVTSPVKWESVIRKMIADGVDTFIEIGPGKTLCGFVNKIDKNVKALNVEDMASLQATLDILV